MQSPPCTTIEKENKMVEDKFPAWAVELLGFIVLLSYRVVPMGETGRRDMQWAWLAQGYGKHLRENYWTWRKTVFGA